MWREIFGYIPWPTNVRGIGEAGSFYVSQTMSVQEGRCGGRRILGVVFERANPGSTRIHVAEIKPGQRWPGETSLAIIFLACLGRAIVISLDGVKRDWRRTATAALDEQQGRRPMPRISLKATPVATLCSGCCSAIHACRVTQAQHATRWP